MRELRYCAPHTLTRRYVYLNFNGLNILRSLFFVPLQFVRVASENPHCRPKFVNSSTRKTCQCSRVASFAGRGGWFQMSLALSRFERISQVTCQLGSCLGNLPLLCAVVGKRGHLLQLSRVASLGREVDLPVWCFVPLVAKWVLSCD